MRLWKSHQLNWQKLPETCWNVLSCVSKFMVNSFSTSCELLNVLQVVLNNNNAPYCTVLYPIFTLNEWMLCMLLIRCGLFYIGHPVLNYQYLICALMLLLTVACFFLPVVTLAAISRSSFLTLMVSSRGEAGGGESPGDGGGGGDPPSDLNTASISSKRLGPKSNDFYHRKTNTYISTRMEFDHIPCLNVADI